MAANTDPTRLNLVGRIALLAGNAIELIVRENGTLRDLDQVKRLDRALQLFKNNKLGEVQMYLPDEPEKPSVVRKRVQDLRMAFRAKIDQLGEYEVEEVFAKGLSGRIRNKLLGYRWSRHRTDHHHQQQLRKLVALTEEEVIDGTGIGKVSLPEFVKALAKEGLSLGMKEGEIEECFGSEKVRVVIYLRDKTGHKVGTGMEVVIVASDGETYRSISYANGAYFQLPPGECTVVEPELHSPHSNDGYERLRLETGRGEKEYDFQLAE